MAAFTALGATTAHRPVWLDSALVHPRLGQRSILAADPTITVEISRTGHTTVRFDPYRPTAKNTPATADTVDAGGAPVDSAVVVTAPTLDDPFALLDALVALTLHPPTPSPLGAQTGPAECRPGGGWIGFFGYDLKNFLERLPPARPDDFGLPAAWFGFYPAWLLFDHITQTAEFVGTTAPALPASFALPGFDQPIALDSAIVAVEPALARLQRHLQHHHPPPTETAAPSGFAAPVAFAEADVVAASNFADRSAYERGIARCVEYIHAGDIFQANISQRFALPFAGDPVALYAELRRANPAPFAAFLGLGDGRAVLSSSPERFLKFAGEAVESRPIKGTRERRDNDEIGNARRRADLLTSAKDRAELAMIVDLVRNDLGKTCLPGSVRVIEDSFLETYATVYHLVATITGQLRPGISAINALREAFPGGSITGAPKIRAMEIIDELEPSARGLYTGSIGYFSHGGLADFNIAIRTMIVGNGTLGIQAGGGIVADSLPAAEYDETLAKARGMIAALRPQPHL